MTYSEPNIDGNPNVNLTPERVPSPDPVPTPKSVPSDEKPENCVSEMSKVAPPSPVTDNSNEPSLADALEAHQKLKKQDSKSKSSKVKFRKNKVVLTGGNIHEQNKAKNCPVRLSIETEQDKNEKRRFNRNREYGAGDANAQKYLKNEQKEADLPKGDYFKNNEYKPDYKNDYKPDDKQAFFKPRELKTKKLFVGGLPDDVTEGMVKEYFETFGDVEEIMMKPTRGFCFVTMADLENAKKILAIKGHMLPDVKNEQQKEIHCKPAINNFERKPIRSIQSMNSAYRPPYNPQFQQQRNHHYVPKETPSPKPIESLAATKIDNPNPESQNQQIIETNKLFVGGLPVKTTEADLNEYFSKYGPIENINIMVDQQTSRPRGFGFITFSDAKDARKCLDATNSADSENSGHKLHDKIIDVKTAVSKMPNFNKLENQGNQSNAYDQNRSQNYPKQPSAGSYFNPGNPFPSPAFSAAAPVFPMMGHPNFPVPPFGAGPTFHHHHNHFYIPTPNSLQTKPKNQQPPQKPSESLNCSQNNQSSKQPEKNPESQQKNSNNQPKVTSQPKTEVPANFITQQQQIMQMPTLGPHAWGGFHPQHSHQLTYAKIFVGGLKRETTKNDLEDYFSHFGKVRKLDLVMDPQEPNKNRGFAFVQYETVEACELACGQQYHTIDGHKVEVKRAILKPPGNSGNDTPGINAGGFYGQRGVVASGGFPMPFLPPFNPYVQYPGSFGFEQQPIFKPGAQQNIPAPKNSEKSDTTGNKNGENLSSEKSTKTDENNNKV